MIVIALSHSPVSSPNHQHHPPPPPPHHQRRQYLTLPASNEDTALLLRARRLLQEVAASVQLDIGLVRPPCSPSFFPSFPRTIAPWQLVVSTNHESKERIGPPPSLTLGSTPTTDPPPQTPTPPPLAARPHAGISGSVSGSGGCFFPGGAGARGLRPLPPRFHLHEHDGAWRGVARCVAMNCVITPPFSWGGGVHV